MAIKKVINGKEVTIADKSIVSHEQLSGREAYGAHPISAIRKLPEKLYELKEKDQKLESQIEANSNQVKKAVDFVIEENLKLHNEFEKASQSVSNIEENVNKVKFEISEDENTVTFTGVDNKDVSFRVGNDVDNDSITFNDNKQITLNKVYINENELVGTGTPESPLELKNKFDNKTIILDEKVSQIYSGGIRGSSEDEFISYKNIIDTNQKFEDAISNVNAKVDSHSIVTDNQQTQINDLKARTQGIGGYLNAYDFKTDVPSQETLTKYALSQISGITDKTQIYNGTKVKNLSDNRV